MSAVMIGRAHPPSGRRSHRKVNVAVAMMRKLIPEQDRSTAMPSSPNRCPCSGTKVPVVPVNKPMNVVTGVSTKPN
jgi:hypothetical protein